MTVDEILAALQAIIDEAGGEGEPLSDEQVEAYEKLEVELKKAQKREAIAARHSGYTAIVTPAGAPSATRRPGETLAKAFNAYLRTGKENADIQQLRPTNAQSEGIGSEGGFLVPDEFRDKLVEKLKAFGGIAGAAEELNTSTGAPIEWPTVDDTDNEGEIVQEGNTFSSGADVVFGVASLGAYSYATGGGDGSGAGVRVSRELAQDSAFDLEALLTRLFTKRIGRIQARHLATGSGVGQPLGLVTGLTGVQLNANTGITYADLVHFIHSVDPEYRQSGNCRWIFNDGVMETLELMTDSHGDPIWRPAGQGMGEGLQEGRLLGYPVTIDQALPDPTLNSATVNWGAFGNIRDGYVVRRVKDVEILVNPYARMAQRQIEYSAWARMDATQQDTNAYVALTGKA